MNEKLSEEYISKNNKITERQLVIAAHRLARTIEMIFNPKEEDLSTEQQSGNDNFLQ